MSGDTNQEATGSHIAQAASGGIATVHHTEYPQHPTPDPTFTSGQGCSCIHPVCQGEARDLAEVAQIACDEDSTLGKSNAGDQQISMPDFA